MKERKEGRDEIDSYTEKSNKQANKRDFSLASLLFDTCFQRRPEDHTPDSAKYTHFLTLLLTARQQKSLQPGIKKVTTTDGQKDKCFITNINA